MFYRLLRKVPKTIGENRNKNKSFFIESVLKYFPPELKNRKKMGFVLPWEKWMKNDLRSFCEESILNLEYYPALNMGQVNLLWKDFIKGKPNINWLQIWSLVVLGKWTSINLSNKNK